MLVHARPYSPALKPMRTIQRPPQPITFKGVDAENQDNKKDPGKKQKYMNALEKGMKLSAAFTIAWAIAYGVSEKFGENIDPNTLEYIKMAAEAGFFKSLLSLFGEAGLYFGPGMLRRNHSHEEETPKVTPQNPSIPENMEKQE